MPDTTQSEKNKIEATLDLGGRYVLEAQIAFDRHINKRTRFFCDTIAKKFRLQHADKKAVYNYYGSYIFEPYTMRYLKDPHLHGNCPCSENY